VTYNLQIDEKEAVKCIIEENSSDDPKKIQRERKCKNDKLFLCQLCKVNIIKNKNILKIILDGPRDFGS
jgi:hypothetical protein